MHLNKIFSIRLVILFYCIFKCIGLQTLGGLYKTKYAIFQHLKRILDWISQCLGPDWTPQNSFKIFPHLGNLAFSNCSKNVLNVIYPNGVKMAIFFPKKIARIAQWLGLCPQALIVVTFSLHTQSSLSTTFKIVIT